MLRDKGVKRVAVVFLVVTAVVASYCIGGYSVRESFASTGQLSAQGDTWESGNASSTVICDRTGKVFNRYIWRRVQGRRLLRQYTNEYIRK